jgi:hypothetical protein
MSVVVKLEAVCWAGSAAHRMLELTSSQIHAGLGLAALPYTRLDHTFAVPEEQCRTSCCCCCVIVFWKLFSSVLKTADLFSLAIDDGDGEFSSTRGCGLGAIRPTQIQRFFFFCKAKKIMFAPIRDSLKFPLAHVPYTIYLLQVDNLKRLQRQAFDDTSWSWGGDRITLREWFGCPSLQKLARNHSCQGRYQCRCFVHKWHLRSRIWY